MRILAVEQADQVVRLADGASAEISDVGDVTIMQDAGHAVTLTPGQMYELIIWTVERHLSYLDFKAHEFPQEQCCFECREPLERVGYIYHTEEGNIQLCLSCHTDVAQTVVDLQRCDWCGRTVDGSYTASRGKQTVPLCFSCFAEVAEVELQSQQMEHEDLTEL